MKRAFRNLKLSRSSIDQVTRINEILSEYHGQGYTLTLRQLYYQLVSRDIIANDDKEYKKLSRVLGEARMSGLIDWDMIEDRVRVPKYPYYVNSLKHAIDDTISQYRFDRITYQPDYMEVWIEKDALSSIFYRATEPYGIKLMVNRGYSSISAMYDAYVRFRQAKMKGKYIFYFGDHDPSGLDMIRDIQTRMDEFGVSVEVIPVALNMEQIETYGPPPNPAKITDPRAKWYISQYGNTSWELDALSPQVLEEMVNNTIREYWDLDIHLSVLEREQEDIDKLKSIKP